MSSYGTKSIRDVTKVLIDYRGKTPSKTRSGVKLITAKVIKGGFIVDGDHEYIADEEYDTWMKRGLPRQWDILITTEAPLGEVAQLRTSEKVALAQRVILLRGDSSIIHQGYFFHALKSPFVQAGLRARSSGTTVLGIKQSELWQVQIPCPPLPIQERIARILSAYDDLVANNTRRIKILEEFARTIYREWFVDYRFPGHSKVATVDSGGLVGPVGWGRTVVEQTCVAIDDGDWIETKDQGGDSYRLLQISNIGLNTFVETNNYRFVSEETFRRLHCTEILPGYILVARMPTPIGRAWLVTPQPWRMITAVDVAILKPKTATSCFLLEYLNSPETLAACSAQASGTTRARITRKQIASLPVLLPPTELRVRFAEVVGPIFELLDRLGSLNTRLSQSRDMLLPKLISGEVSVEQFEAEAVAQGV